MKLTLLSGTNRPGSSTRRLTDHLAGLYRELGSPAEILDLIELPPEAFRPDAYGEPPPGLARFTDRILASDGLHVVTPEYNGGPPGVLKYFIDLLPFPESFEQRPVCFTGVAAGAWGALRPVEQLQAIFAYRNAYLFPGRVFLPRVHELWSENGLADADTERRLRTQVEGFIAFVGRLRPAG